MRTTPLGSKASSFAESLDKEIQAMCVHTPPNATPLPDMKHNHITKGVCHAIIYISYLR